MKGREGMVVKGGLEMGNRMRSMRGKEEFENGGKDGVKEVMVKKGVMKE